MIITSNSVQHEYTIPNVTVVGDVDGFENVAEKVQIYLHSSVTFDHTYETTIFNTDSQVGVTTTVTEEKTITEFTYYDVELNTDNINADTFTTFNDLEEDQVLQWCFAADSNTIQHRTEMEEKVLEKKDRVLNPKKYYRDTPVTPWRIKKDQESL